MPAKANGVERVGGAGPESAERIDLDDSADAADAMFHCFDVFGRTVLLWIDGYDKDTGAELMRHTE